MIMAVVTDALKSIDEDNDEKALKDTPLTNPRGGFTDVGLHTGGHARDTSWAILEAVMEILLVQVPRMSEKAPTEEAAPMEEDARMEEGARMEDAPEHTCLFTVAMAHLRIWLAEIMVTAASTQGLNRGRINQIVKMLEHAGEAGASLADDEHDMEAFAARCAAVRYELERKVDERAQQASLERMLHPERPLYLSSLTISSATLNSRSLKMPFLGKVRRASRRDMNLQRRIWRGYLRHLSQL